MDFRFNFQKYTYRKICELEDEEREIRSRLNRCSVYNIDILELLEFNARKKAIFDVLDEIEDLLSCSDVPP